jgi:hypothetical protein
VLVAQLFPGHSLALWAERGLLKPETNAAEKIALAGIGACDKFFDDCEGACKSITTGS